MTRRHLAFVAIALVLPFAGAARHAEAATPPKCELDRPVVFAAFDWDSNAFHTALARFIMEVGYGCRTDAIPGSTLPLLAGMARGDIDVAMEVWKDNVTAPWTKGVKAGKLAELGVNFPDAVQGWFIPRYLRDGDPARGIKPLAPGLRRVQDLRKYKALFRDPEEPDKGRFYNCILGWSCEKVNTRKLRAYGLDAYFTNFRPGTGAALAAVIASRYKRGKPFVAYYWGPSWVLGRYDLVMLEEPPYNEKDWLGLAARDDYPRAVAYPVVKVVIGVNTRFKAAAPKLIAFLTRYETTNAMISKALAGMAGSHGDSATDAAIRFLKTRADVWTKWVPPDVAARVKAGLKK